MSPSLLGSPQKNNTHRPAHPNPSLTQMSSSATCLWSCVSGKGNLVWGAFDTVCMLGIRDESKHNNSWSRWYRYYMGTLLMVVGGRFPFSAFLLVKKKCTTLTRNNRLGLIPHSPVWKPIDLPRGPLWSSFISILLSKSLSSPASFPSSMAPKQLASDSLLHARELPVLQRSLYLWLAQYSIILICVPGTF